MSNVKMVGFQTVSGSIAKTFPRIFAVMALFLVAGCGVSYTSPKVKTSDLGNAVQIVPLTPPTIAVANRSKYSPRRLPDVFYAAAGGGSFVGAGAIPVTPYVPEERRGRLDYRPLPELQTPPYRIGIGDVLLLATRGSASTVEQLSGLLAAQNQRQG